MTPSAATHTAAAANPPCTAPTRRGTCGTRTCAASAPPPGSASSRVRDTPAAKRPRRAPPRRRWGTPSAPARTGGTRPICSTSGISAETFPAASCQISVRACSCSAACVPCTTAPSASTSLHGHARPISRASSRAAQPWRVLWWAGASPTSTPSPSYARWRTAATSAYRCTQQTAPAAAPPPPARSRGRAPRSPRPRWPRCGPCTATPPRSCPAQQTDT
mmetsp:Transcript_24760/g.60046  ORF Transcript_24760/g.60046 Transcript_24760/m.60046 type:complete len:219 (-) Transcript_24760:278-934(-)